jgi:signal transduction histidine kinase
LAVTGPAGTIGPVRTTGWGQRAAIARDVLPVVALAGFCLGGLYGSAAGDPAAGDVVVSVLLWLPALVRRRAPLLAFAATAAVVAGHWVPDGFDPAALLPADVALWFVLVGVADRCAGRWALAAAAVCEAAALATLIGERTGMPGHPAVPLTAITVAAALFGRNRRNHRAYLTSLRDRAERAERELDQQARVAVAEERTRIAREVHDVVSHNLSVMTALADGAGFAMRSAAGRQQAEDAVAQVATTGRAALAEMHRLLGVLREDDGSPALRPPPGLDQLEELVEQVRAAGLPTTLTVAGRPVPIGPTAQLAVYRLVQESLTNSLQHAVAPPGRLVRARVALHWADDVLRVEVVDDGAGTAPSVRTGHGLAGMRERLGAWDGTVCAGPGPTGGWRVAGQLPLTDAAAVRA